MVVLERIKLNKTGIECDYNPEKSGMIGHIDLQNDGATRITYSSYELGKQTYAAMAVNKLKELLESTNEVPNKAEVMWY